MPLDETSTASQTAPWPEIDGSLLNGTRPPPVPFPLDLLPEAWRAWAQASAQAFTPVDYLAQGLLSAVAAVCGGGIVVRVTPQWREPLVLWQALVGGPSSGKSPALAAARRLLDGIEIPTGRGEAAAPGVLAEASLRRLVAMGLSAPGVTLWCEDLAGGMAGARQGRDRAGWLAGWSGGEASVAKAPGYWSLGAERFPLGIVGALQPDRLADAFGSGADGFAARFLYGWPEATACAALGDRAADDDGVRALLQRIAGLVSTAEAPGELSLGSEAVARLEQLLPGLRRQMDEAGDAEAGWIGKGAGTIVRLAGLLTLMEWAGDGASELPGKVEPWQLDRAHALWSGYFLPHAQRVLGATGADGRDRLAGRAARWLRRAGLAQISREDIRRAALCQTVDAEGADQVIERLEAGGMLRPLAPHAGGSRGPLRRRWEVNPAVR